MPLAIYLFLISASMMTCRIVQVFHDLLLFFQIVFIDKSDDKDIKFENILHLVTHLIEKETLVFHESGSKMILKEPISVVSDVDS